MVASGVGVGAGVAEQYDRFPGVEVAAGCEVTEGAPGHEIDVEVG